MSEPPVGSPPRTLDAGPVTLVAFEGGEAEELTQVVAQDVDHLRPWMPWAAEPISVEAQAEFVRSSVASWEQCDGFGYWLREAGSGELVGCAGLMTRQGPGALEIGYWVRASRVRRGYATAAARALTDAAFGVPGVERVEIHCDEANVASAGVPRALGYRLARVEDRPAEAPSETGRHMVWVVDAPDWRAGAAGVRASS